MPTAVARLRLRTAPVGIGMPTSCSAYRSRTDAGNPLDSLPNSRQSPSAKSARVYGFWFGVSTHQMREEPLPHHALEVLERNVPHHIDRVPVVETSAPQRAVVEPEPEAPDQVEARPGRGAKSRDVPGVGRYLWFPQCNVQHATSPIVPAVRVVPALPSGEHENRSREACSRVQRARLTNDNVGCARRAVSGSAK